MTRLRDLGLSVGQLQPGPLNAITDVAGVRVGSVTLIEGDGPLVVSGLEQPLQLTHLTSRQVGEDVLLEAYVREP